MAATVKTAIGIAIAASAALATCIYVWQGKAGSGAFATPPSTSILLRVDPSHVKSSTPANSSVAHDRVRVATRPVNAHSESFKESFAKSRDYWAYAHSILPAAIAGDPDAQFYLARSIERCSEDNRMYFQHRGAVLNLDEGLQYAAKRHLPVELAQKIFERCHQFQEQDPTDLGNAADWLAKATEAGQPLAQTTTATKLFLQNLQRNAANAGGVAPVDPPIASELDAPALLRAAVESNDPEVLFDIGTLKGVLDSSNVDDERTTRFAWWLVACQHGLDCSSKAEWVLNTCFEDPQCASASGPTDLIRSLAGNDWAEVEQRARDINAKLASGSWGALGLGP